MQTASNDTEELPKYGHAQQKYSFFIGDGPRVVATPDDCGLWVREIFLSEVMESIVHGRELLDMGRIDEAREKFDDAYQRLRTPTTN